MNHVEKTFYAANSRQYEDGLTWYSRAHVECGALAREVKIETYQAQAVVWSVFRETRNIQPVMF
jgi:hypothetical protein